MHSSRKRPRRHSPFQERKSETYASSDSEEEADLRTVLKLRNQVEVITTSKDSTRTHSSTSYQASNSQARSSHKIRTLKVQRSRTKGQPLPPPACIMHPRSSSHCILNCTDFKDMNYKERILILRKRNVCLRCAGLHNTSSCRVKIRCELCEGRHLTLLHDPRKDPPPAPNPLALVVYHPPRVPS